MKEIAYCKIFPPIGIARVGDSINTELNKGWFIGPEFNDTRPVDFSYKDEHGKIKRQAARFRVYGFDKDDKPIGEIKGNEAEITWSVQLANKKAAWFNFEGANRAMHYFRGEFKKRGDDDALEKHFRNPQIGKLHLDKEHTKYIPTVDRKEMLEIDGGERKIHGINKDNGAEFYGNFKRTHRVFLGELKTDELGRLCVLGGHGKSEPISNQGTTTTEDGEPFINSRWIRNYANNDDWHDDISDGPVNADVKINGKTIPVEGSAWVIVTPPDFAPDVKNIVSLYDVMEEVAWQNKKLQNKTTNEINSPNVVNFGRDIKPFFERLHSQRWVNARGLRGHGTGKPGDFQKDNGNDPLELDPDLSALSEPSKIKKNRIFSVLRQPAYLRVVNDELKDDYDSPKAKEQAVTTYMPPLAGDEGDPESGNPKSWLSVTRLQYERLTKWSKNDFVNVKTEKENNEVKAEIEALTKTALESCAGGAFYPGIEMTSIARDPKLYIEAFRLNHKILEAGDVSKYMALPWQADFWECRDHWWPAQRPDDIVPSEEFDAIFDKFNSDVDKNYEMVLFERIRWDRGIGNTSRPANSYLFNCIFPEVDQSIAIGDYIDFIANTVPRIPLTKNIRIDSLSVIFTNISGINSYDSGAILPSPSRLQYIAQEALDAYSGLYFHLVVPSPAEVFTPTKNNPVKLDCLKNNHIENILSDWSNYRLLKPSDASEIVSTYTQSVVNNISESVKSFLLKCPAAKGDVISFRQFFLHNSVDKIEQHEVYNDIYDNTDVYCNLRALEMLHNAMDYLYTDATTTSGDMDMVNDWKKMGFVAKKEVNFESSDKKKIKNTLQLESERSKYAGKSFRDYFYYLNNIEEFQDFIPYAKTIAEDILASAQYLIDLKGLDSQSIPESFVPYSREAFDAKMLEIYEITRQQAVQAIGCMDSRTREKAIRRIYDNAVYNQCDGAWLRFVANAGTTDEVRSLLFEVWSDEIGNGNPALHHGNLYTTLMASLGISLPPLNSRAYADNTDLDESLFITPVFELAISQHSEDYFPELLGMTLFLEWEVLTLVSGVKGLTYLGIDPHFWEMHVGIDNASNGHGAKAKQAVEIYLDKIFKESGEEAVQEEWKRIWRGFIAFDIAGYGYFSNKDVDNNRDDLTLSRLHAGTPEDKIKNLMQRKAQFGSLNHGAKNIGGHRINDLFEEPDMFVDQLANSPYVTPGKPDESRLINYLTTFEGPMYKVFNDADMKLWKDWIEWLGKEGDTESSKKYLTKAEAMFLLLNELKELAQSVAGHKMYKMENPAKEDKSTTPKKLTIADFFNMGDMRKLMEALAQPDNGWAVPYNPTASPIVVDFASPIRPMGAALDRQFISLGNQVGRVVLIKWINAGCPLLDQRSKPKIPPPAEQWNGKRLLVQKIGIGAVH